MTVAKNHQSIHDRGFQEGALSVLLPVLCSQWLDHYGTGVGVFLFIVICHGRELLERDGITTEAT